MSNLVVTDSTISVNSRGSMQLPFKVYDTDVNGTTTQRDIHAATYYFEVDGIPIRKLLVADPNDAKGLLIQLNTTEVGTLKTRAEKFVVRDETDATYPVVQWEGTILRTGYLGAPDTVED